MRQLLVALCVAVCCLAACGGIELNPLVNEPRIVHLERDPSKTLTVIEDMVFADKSHATRQISFPAGTYALEAEDADYWYLRGAAPLSLREFKKGVQTESHTMRGGIAIGKYATRSVPAAGYIDGQESSRILIWKLSREFLSRDGKDWRKSF